MAQTILWLGVAKVVMLMYVWLREEFNLFHSNPNLADYLRGGFEAASLVRIKENIR